MTLSYDIRDSATYPSGVAVIHFNERDLNRSLEDDFRNTVAVLSLKNTNRIVLDVSGAESIDSYFFSLLVQIHRELKPGQGRIAVTGVGGHLKQVFRAVRLDEVFTIHDTLLDAIEEVERSDD